MVGRGRATGVALLACVAGGSASPLLADEAGTQVVATPGASPAQKILEGLSLQEAMRLAVERNPSITQAELDVTLAELTAERARLDRIGVSVDAAVGDTASLAWQPSTSTAFADQDPFSNGLEYGVSATVTVPLYTGGATRARIARATLGVHREEVDQALVQRDLERAVYQSYWNIQGYDLQVAAGREALTQSREALTVIEAKLKNGLAAPIDLNRFQVDVLSQEQQLASLELQAYNARQKLLELLHLDGESLTLSDAAKEVEPARIGRSVAELQERAHRDRIELKSLELTLTSAGYDRIIARSGKLPQVNLNLGAEAGAQPAWQNQTTYDQAEFTPAVGASAGVSLSWNLFNRGQTDYQVRQVDIGARQVKAQLEAQRATIDEQVKTSYQTLLTLKQREPGVQKQLELARDNLNIIQTLYSQGNATILDLFDAQSAYRTALAQEASHRIDLTVAEYELRWTVGDPFQPATSAGAGERATGSQP